MGGFSAINKVMIDWLEPWNYDHLPEAAPIMHPVERRHHWLFDPEYGDSVGCTEDAYNPEDMLDVWNAMQSSIAYRILTR